MAVPGGTAIPSAILLSGRRALSVAVRERSFPTGCDRLFLITRLSDRQPWDRCREAMLWDCWVQSERGQCWRITGRNLWLCESRFGHR